MNWFQHFKMVVTGKTYRWNTYEVTAKNRIESHIQKTFSECPQIATLFSEALAASHCCIHAHMVEKHGGVVVIDAIDEIGLEEYVNIHVFSTQLFLFIVNIGLKYCDDIQDLDRLFRKVFSESCAVYFLNRYYCGSALDEFQMEKFANLYFQEVCKIANVDYSNTMEFPMRLITSRQIFYLYASEMIDVARTALR